MTQTRGSAGNKCRFFFFFPLVSILPISAQLHQLRTAPHSTFMFRTRLGGKCIKSFFLFSYRGVNNTSMEREATFPLSVSLLAARSPFLSVLPPAWIQQCGVSEFHAVREEAVRTSRGDVKRWDRGPGPLYAECSIPNTQTHNLTVLQPHFAP